VLVEEKERSVTHDVVEPTRAAFKVLGYYKRNYKDKKTWTSSNYFQNVLDFLISFGEQQCGTTV
jgi:hypothetical protein